MVLKGRKFAYVVILCIVLLSAVLLYSWSQIQKATDRGNAIPALSGVVGQEDKSPAEKTMLSSPESQRCPIVRQVILLPKQPTVIDSIKAELSLDSPTPANIDYEYKWFINDKLVESAHGDTLPSGLAKKRDRISVNVTPILNGERGVLSQSYFCVIHSSPPALSLKDEISKVGEIIELQLVGVDTDGEKITYALEDPRLDGMTVDKITGKITWKPTEKQTGICRFGASASNADGSKRTKVFEISLDTK
jgi:hypothetical protein